MELLQLKYFSAAAAQEHITKAAEQLHIAQPALTQSIRRLEEELGVRLFNRSGRNIVLNEAGKLFLKRIAPILAELDRIPEEIREARGDFPQNDPYERRSRFRFNYKNHHTIQSAASAGGISAHAQ